MLETRVDSALSWRLSRDTVLWLFLLDFRAYNHGFQGRQEPKTFCDNSILRSYLSPSVFTVRLEPVWRQHLPSTTQHSRVSTQTPELHL